MVKIKKLHPDAKLPVRNFSLDAGADLFSVENVTIQPQQRFFVDTGIAIQATDKDTNILWFSDLEDGGNQEVLVKSYFRIAPKSGLAFMYGIDTLAGVVDLGYSNSIKVGLYNTGTEPFEVTKGMKIAQLIREVCIMDNFHEVDALEDTDRGLGGFGSTGL